MRKKLQLLKENVLWGGSFRAKIYINLLLKYYKSKIYRDWGLKKVQPHFFDQRAGLFITAFDKKPIGFYEFTRGFNAAELIKESDKLLDIGCGDGFFTKHFFARKCSHIDAVDIEPSAITAAKKLNSHKKINYVLSDAVANPFPNTGYDIIVWDGAIGHFASDTVGIMLKKITNALKPNGVFVGSESLGKEGHDHLQFFDSLESMSKLFKTYFKYVALKSIDYVIPGNFLRSEAFWKCANTPDRIELTDWKYF